jgi:uncharacterized membrane protein (DUF106 family)
LYNNNIISDFYDSFDKLKTKAADTNFTGNIPSKKVTQDERLRNKFSKASQQISDINKKIKEAEKANDTEKVKELRRRMIDIANKTNQLIK